MRQHEKFGVRLVTGELNLVGSADLHGNTWETTVIEVDGNMFRDVQYSPLIKEYLEPGESDGFVLLASRIIAVRNNGCIVLDEDNVPTESKAWLQCLFLTLFAGIGLLLMFFLPGSAAKQHAAVQEAIEYLETIPLTAES